jgi:Sulfatase-modifying factor enzyme 1
MHGCFLTQGYFHFLRYMTPHRLRQKFFYLWQAIGTWVLGATGVLMLGFLWYFLATTGPSRDGEVVAPEMSFDNPRLAAMASEVDILEKQYQVFATAGTVTDEAIIIMESAVEKQRQMIRAQVKPDYAQLDKLARLEKQLDSARAGRLVSRVERLFVDGEEAQAANRLPDAKSKFEEALKIQREINGGSADSKFKNYVRESSLEQAIISLTAYPLHLEKEEALKKATAAMAEQRWTDALSAYTVARDVLERLNRDFTRTRYADTAGLSQVSGEIQSLNAAGLATQVADQEKAGDLAEASSDHASSATAFLKAYNAQTQVNTEFPRSRFVSSTRLDALDVKLQSARSAPVAQELEKLELAIREDLRRRRVVAAEQKLPQATELSAKMMAEFPRSRFVDGALRIRLSYLALKRNELRKLQDTVYEHVLAIPGVDERLILASEVPQSLYNVVMNTNPSRNPGRVMPVDSVNWNDASEFCTRLGWMLGLKVRLPTLDEFRVAVGNGEGETRNSVNGGRPGATDTARPNDTGFRDLLGNLGEWLDAPENTDKATVAGGSYLDNPDALAKLPAETRSKVDRARHVGFRFVVEAPR